MSSAPQIVQRWKDVRADAIELTEWGMSVQQQVLMRPPSVKTERGKAAATKFLKDLDRLLRELRASTEILGR